MPRVLSKEQLRFYGDNGYLHVSGAMPKDVLGTAQRLNEHWSNLVMDQWHREGSLSDQDKEEADRQDFWHRFLYAWEASGRPPFRRSPFRRLFIEETYDLLRNPSLLAIAEDLLGTSEISVHGIFNARAGMPNDTRTATPWHQDSMEWHAGSYSTGLLDDLSTHVVTFWIPLQKADANTGCLEVISLKQTGGKTFKPYDYDYANTGYIGISPNEIKQYDSVVIEMDCSDVLAFGQNTPHATVRNKSDRIRWSMDIRYEATDNATHTGKKFGFVAQSKVDPGRVTPFEEWLKKQQG